VSVANYVASNNPDVAEVAVAVAHRHHLRGVATTLLQRLAKIALCNGIRTFTADVLAGHGQLNAAVNWLNKSFSRLPTL
jgi:L-amino acid N-acyltransferase YncA